MHIREGAQLEIFTDNEGCVIFRKYSPIGELENYVEDYAETLAKVTGNTVAVTDKETVIAAAGSGKKEIIGQKLSEETENLLENRKAYVYRIGDERKTLCEGIDKAYASLAEPIFSDGDVIGSLVMLIPEKGNEATESEIQIFSTASMLLRKQLET